MARAVRQFKLPPPQEWKEQEALMTWARLHEGTEPRLRLLYCIANGEKRPPVTAAKLAVMGVKRGVPDMHLACPMIYVTGIDGAGNGELDVTPGLYLELKRLGKGNALSPEQLEWKAMLLEQGFRYLAPEGWIAAAKGICDYLSRPDLMKGIQ